MNSCLAILLSAASPAAAETTISTPNGTHHAADRQGNPDEVLIWDNGDYDGSGAWASQIDLIYVWDGQAADDFALPTAGGGEQCWDITRIEWTGLYWNGTVQPLDFRIIIYDDDGSGTSPTGGPNDPTPTARCVRETANAQSNETWNAAYEAYDYSAEISPACTLQAGAKYWISVQANYFFPPQWGFAKTAIKGHSAKQGFPNLQVDYWEDRENDLSFKIIGRASDGCVQAMKPSVLVGCQGVSGSERFALADDEYLSHFMAPSFYQSFQKFTYGPDGNIYRRVWTSPLIHRFDNATGADMGIFANVQACGGLHHFVFGPDGNMYVGSSDRKICRYDGLTGEFLDNWAATQGQPLGLRFGPDGNLYVAEGQCVTRYDGNTGQMLGVVTDHVSSARVLRFAPDGRLFAMEVDPGRINMYDPQTGDFLGMFNQDGPLIEPVDFTIAPNGAVYAASSQPDMVTVLDLATGHVTDLIASDTFTILKYPDAIEVMILPGDLNQDNSVDLRDFAAFQHCYTVDAGNATANCLAADVDDDGDADGRDYQYLSVNLSGPMP